MHVWMVLLHGVSDWPMPGRIVKKSTYEREYHELAEKTGIPFVPDAAWKDAVFAAAIMFSVMACAFYFGPFGPSGPPDPTIIQTAPKPDFAFLWIYAVLAFLPPSIETPVILVVPVLGIAALLLLPLIAAEGERNWARRPVAVLMVSIIAVSLGIFTKLGTYTPWSPIMDAWTAYTVPAKYLQSRTPLERQGALVLQNKQCRNCHALDGIGGQRGPALDEIATRMTEDQIIRQVLQGGGNMPAYGNALNPSETKALVQFLMTLRGNNLEPATDSSRRPHTYKSVAAFSARRKGSIGMSDAIHDVLADWSLPIWLTLSIVVTAIIYLNGWIAIRRTRPERFSGLRLASFMAGLATLWLAIGSPLDGFADAMLSAHMVEHLLLMSVVPPLLLYGWPVVPMLRGIPSALRRPIVNPFIRSSSLRRLGHWLVTPLVAWLAMNLTFLGWHIPAAYDFALEHENWHAVEHLCFLGTSIMFWWCILRPWPTQSRRNGWGILIYLISADVVNTVLSAFLAFCGRAVYPYYFSHPNPFGIGPEEDQVLGAVVMWVLGSFVFLVPGVVIAYRLVESGGHSRLYDSPVARDAA